MRGEVCIMLQEILRIVPAGALHQPLARCVEALWETQLGVEVAWRKTLLLMRRIL